MNKVDVLMTQLNTQPLQSQLEFRCKSINGTQDGGVCLGFCMHFTCLN